MEWLAVAVFVFACFIVLPVTLLLLRDRRAARRAAVDAAHLRRPRPELWFGTPEHNARFDHPDFAALEGHIGRPLPAPLKELFLQSDVVRNGCFIITPPGGSNELWFEQFEPIDRLSISGGSFRSAWVDGPWMPFATDILGNEFQLAIESMTAEDAIVYFYNQKLGTHEIVADSLKAMLSWPRRSSEDEVIDEEI
jgi:hypothetical protein